MTIPDVDQPQRAWMPPEPSLEQHNEIVTCCERRFLRADEKLAAAATEHNDSHAALCAARAARAAFVAANPDPQLGITFLGDGE